jgi:superkiller protein 3
MTFRQSAYYRNNEILFQQNIEKNPAAWPAYNVLGVEMEKKGNMKEAEFWFRKSVEQNPRFVNALNNLGILLAREGKTREAMDLFQRALDIKPALSQTHMNLGLAFSLEKNYDKALFHLKESIRLDPQSTSGHYNLALILMERGELEQGVSYLRKTLSLDPSQPEVWLRLGEGCAKLGKTLDAVQAYEAALRLIPDLPLALSSLAIIYSSSKDPGIKDPDKAIDLAERACRLNNYKSARFLLTLGTVYAEKGRIEDGLKTLKTALERAESQKNEALSREIGGKIKAYEKKKTEQSRK